MLIEVKIGALIMDPNTNTPIVVLKGIDSETILPIWVMKRLLRSAAGLTANPV